MQFIIDNWSLLVAILALIFAAILSVKKWLTLPPEEREKQIKQWLLYVVIQAESELGGGGTGRVKLSSVYGKFVEKFGVIALLMPFDKFSKLVDEALEQMRHMLESNERIKAIVEDGVVSE